MNRDIIYMGLASAQADASPIYYMKTNPFKSDPSLEILNECRPNDILILCYSMYMSNHFSYACIQHTIFRAYLYYRLEMKLRPTHQ